uniref:Uncharacterized protein n=1 Tax=Onchocerca volvulus TaxID=6282 RepID=A0A8R1TJQ9_ONCVO
MNFDFRICSSMKPCKAENRCRKCRIRAVCSTSYFFISLYFNHSRLL